MGSPPKEQLELFAAIYKFWKLQRPDQEIEKSVRIDVDEKMLIRFDFNDSDESTMIVTITIEQLRELVALQAEDDALWAAGVHIETAYVQQGLRWLTHAIEGTWTFEQASDAIKEMQP